MSMSPMAWAILFFLKGKLKEAAELKNDQALLVHFLTDAVASEMKYHAKCYSDYTKPLYRKDTLWRPGLK